MNPKLLLNVLAIVGSLGLSIYCSLKKDKDIKDLEDQTAEHISNLNERLRDLEKRS